MRHGYEAQLTDTSQHAIGESVGTGLDVDRKRDAAFLFARACFPHCLAMARERIEGPIPGHLFEYISFIESSGPRPDGTHDTGLYVHERGWNHVAMGDLLRLRGYEVFVQNLSVQPREVDHDKLRSLGRVRTVGEMALAEHLSAYTGEQRSRWSSALQVARRIKAVPIPTISIPRLDGNGMGGHTVLVRHIRGGRVYYSDPDAKAIDRYRGDAEQQGITAHRDALAFSQPSKDFVARMTGEVMWVTPPSDKTE